MIIDELINRAVRFFNMLKRESAKWEVRIEVGSGRCDGADKKL